MAMASNLDNEYQRAGMTIDAQYFYNLTPEDDWWSYGAEILCRFEALTAAEILVCLLDAGQKNVVDKILLDLKQLATSEAATIQVKFNQLRSRCGSASDV
jgi:hypothetical protein